MTPKTLIFSDSHLTHRFDRKKFEFLKRIITPVDQVIINGDFWDRFFCSFDAFINSPWQQLFPLLKLKRAIYLYGNHDPKEKTDTRVSYFSVEAKYRHIIKQEEVTYRIEHGQHILPSLEMQYPWLFDNRGAIILNNIINAIGIRLFGFDYLELRNKSGNSDAKRHARTHIKKNEFLIIGHTHLQEIDHSSRVAISGMVKNGIGQYILIDDHGIHMKTQRY